MEEVSRTTSRRSLVGRGLLLAAGALGIGETRWSKTARAAVPTGTELSLYGRYLHLHSSSRRAGVVPAKGDRHSAYAELLDRPQGSVVGHFTAARLAQDSPFAAGASSLELHTFSLKDGTIYGLGSAAPGVDGRFVILGGTGRYSGAQGSYVARQHVRELGGNGTAEFHLTLAA
jgi:hypothetical protein